MSICRVRCVWAAHKACGRGSGPCRRSRLEKVLNVPINKQSTGVINRVVKARWKKIDSSIRTPVTEKTHDQDLYMN